MIVLQKQVIFPVKDKIKLHQCEECIRGKHTKQPGSSSTSISLTVLEYIHVDLSGPSWTETLGGAIYFFSIIDDYTRKVWLYVLNTKDQALSKFREWCN